MGVATGCGCKEVYRFPHTTYPYSSCICSFLQQHSYFFFFFLNVFRSYICKWSTVLYIYFTAIAVGVAVIGGLLCYQFMV